MPFHFPIFIKMCESSLWPSFFLFYFHHIYHCLPWFFDEFLSIKGKIPCWFARDFLYPDIAILTGNSQLVFCLFIFYYLFILLDSFVILFYVSVCISTGTHAATGSSDPSFLYCEKNGFTESLVRRFIFLFMFFYVSLFKSRCGLKYGLFWRLALFLREMAVVLLYSPIFCEVFILF